MIGRTNCEKLNVIDTHPTSGEIEMGVMTHNRSTLLLILEQVSSTVQEIDDQECRVKAKQLQLHIIGQYYRRRQSVLVS